MTSPSNDTPPILMLKSEITSLKEAAHRTGKSVRTIQRWCARFGIGRQSGNGAPMEVSDIALEMVMHGDEVALDLLRAGDRRHPRVKRYYDHLGILIEDGPK